MSRPITARHDGTGPHLCRVAPRRSGVITLRLLCAIALPLLVLTSGCAVSMAAHQPDKKNLAVLYPGTPIAVVRAELGAPSWTGKDGDGFDTDVFQFVQGYSKGAKAGRAALHGIADVLTLGLWEAVGTTAETLASGKKLRVTVAYDEKGRVKASKIQDSNGKEIPLASLAPPPA